MHRIPLANLVTIEEAAARRGCSAATIWRRARRGELHLQRLFGRTVVDLAEVDALVMPASGGRWRVTAPSR